MIITDGVMQVLEYIDKYTPCGLEEEIRGGILKITDVHETEKLIQVLYDNGIAGHTLGRYGLVMHYMIDGWNEKLAALQV